MGRTCLPAQRSSRSGISFILGLAAKISNFDFRVKRSINKYNQLFIFIYFLFFMFYRKCRRTARYTSVHYFRFEHSQLQSGFGRGMLNKYIMSSSSKIIVISILTKIILIMIFSIIEQPYRSLSHSDC